MFDLPNDHPLKMLLGTITDVKMDDDETVILEYEDGKVLCIYEDDEGAFTLGFPEGYEA